MNDYKVSLDVYCGPLDLLLFLIRRDEVDICDIPIAKVTTQYLEFVALLRDLDPDAVGEFLVMAATLMEIKSRMLLPTPPPEEAEGPLIDPRHDLVRQLLEYKKFKDAARKLGHAADERADKFPRQPFPFATPAEELELENLDIWDLFEAFKRIWEQVGQPGAVHRVQIDDTPIALHADDILDSLERAGGAQPFEALFLGRGKPEMIGLFLALLELIRRRRVRVSQDQPFGPILIFLLDARPLERELDETDWNETRKESAEPPVTLAVQEVLPSAPEEWVTEGSQGPTEEETSVIRPVPAGENR
jgi:segregation and condensation protein A